MKTKYVVSYFETGYTFNNFFYSLKSAERLYQELSEDKKRGCKITKLFIAKVII